MTIYSRIKELANERNISIRELESTLKFSNGTISKWKDTANSIKLDQVASFFNVSTDYLLGRNTSPNNRNSDAELLAAHLNKDFTDEDMAKIIDYIDMIKRSKN